MYISTVVSILSFACLMMVRANFGCSSSRFFRAEAFLVSEHKEPTGATRLVSKTMV